MLDQTFEAKIETQRHHTISSASGKEFVEDGAGKRLSRDFETILLIKGEVCGAQAEMLVGLEFGKRTPLVYSEKKGGYVEAPGGPFSDVRYDSNVKQFVGVSGLYKRILDPETGESLTDTAYQDFDLRRDGTLVGIDAGGEQVIELRRRGEARMRSRMRMLPRPGICFAPFVMIRAFIFSETEPINSISSATKQVRRLVSVIIGLP
jgi:hypothetical protein